MLDFDEPKIVSFLFRIAILIPDSFLLNLRFYCFFEKSATVRDFWHNPCTAMGLCKRKEKKKICKNIYITK